MEMALQGVPQPSIIATHAGSLARLRNLCKEGQLHEALHAVDVMLQHQLPLSTTIFYCLLQGCIQKKDLAAARRLYSHVTRSRFGSNTFLGSHLIHMFSACGSLSEAAAVFSKLPEPSAFAWSAIISANVRHGQDKEAITLYQKMQQSSMKPDGYVFVATLKACANASSMMTGQLVHAHIVDRSLELDVVIANALIDMYPKCGTLEDAFGVFIRLPKRDVVTWNSMIAGFAQHGQCKEASNLMEQMQSNGVEPNVITWNSILAGYAQNGHGEEALQIFEQMQQTKRKPDCFTFASTLKACASKGALREGKWIHAQMIEYGIELDIQVSNAVVDMYIKCGRMDDAYKEAHKLPIRDVVTWTVMIAGYAQHGHNHKAMQILREMQQENRKPDHFTFATLLKACTSAAALDQGKLIHAYVIESCMESDVYIRSALIDMYAKCGSLECACRLFEKLSERDVVAWSAMIAGFAMHGKYKLALWYVQYMLQEGLQPNAVIFLCLLSVCGHLGIVDEGQSLFMSMTKVHGILPTIEHYNSVVDLLGRAGHLNEAEEILKSMPFQCNAEGWISLLSSCRFYNSVQIGKRCFDRVIAFDKQHASVYVLMSNIYIDANMWKDADKIQEMKNHAGVSKEAGMACIEVENKVHDFCVGDESHPQSDSIYVKLKSMNVYIKEEGHMPQLGYIDAANTRRGVREVINSGE